MSQQVTGFDGVEYSPGPWKRDIIGVVDQNDEPVAFAAVIPWPSDVIEAHLNLIAAAPDLLAFCEALQGRYNVDDRLGGLGDWLDAIIERARGRTS